MLFQQNVNLAPYNTFWIQAKAKFFVEIDSEDSFLQLMETSEWKQYPHLFLWTGANVLFTQDFDGLVVKVNIKGKDILEENQNHILLKVGSWENRNDFVEWTVEKWRAGIENMIAIPSSVGAAAFGNIGAYGMEAKDRIVSVRGIDITTKEILTLNNTECEFWYRESIFKQHFKDGFLITYVQFELFPYNEQYILNTNYKDIQQYISDSWTKVTLSVLSHAITEIRANKLPDRRILWTAGSFFKNPVVSKEKFALLKMTFIHLLSFDIPDDLGRVKLSAWQLIELAGFKWYKKWNVGVYDKHALILVNYGWAIGQDIIDLAGDIQDRVQELFNVYLSPEVIYV